MQYLYMKSKKPSKIVAKLPSTQEPEWCCVAFSPMLEVDQLHGRPGQDRVVGGFRQCFHWLFWVSASAAGGFRWFWLGNVGGGRGMRA